MDRITQSDRWPNTRGSILGAAASSDPDERRRGQSEFFRWYQAAIFAYFFAKMRDRADAEDMTQAFFSEKVVAGTLLSSYDPGKRRFRFYLLTCLGHFATDEHRRRGKQRKAAAAALDKAVIERVSGQGYRDPEAAFNAEFAKSVLTEAIEKCREEAIAGGGAERWTFYERARLSSPGDLSQGLTKAELARLGDLNHPYSELQRIDERLAECVRRVLREQTASGDELAEEIQAMMLSLGWQNAGTGG